jgi:hypothetical protein
VKRTVYEGDVGLAANSYAHPVGRTILVPPAILIIGDSYNSIY